MADMNNMRVDGTQNVSRIDGVYVYPVRRYNTDAISPVEPVKQRQSQIGSKEINQQNLLELYSPNGIMRFQASAQPAFVDRYA